MCRQGKRVPGVLLLLSVPCAALAGTTTIAALGDSLTQGYGLPRELGFVEQLSAWLEQNGEDVRMINAGVSGDTTAGGLARIGWTLGDDVDALIVTLGGNDLLRGLNPGDSRRNITGILAAASDRGVPVLLAGMKAPMNYGPDYKQAFDSIYPELADQENVLLFPEFLGPITQGREMSEVLATLMQQDGIHPNAAGVALIVSAIGPYVQSLIERTNAK